MRRPVGINNIFITYSSNHGVSAMSWEHARYSFFVLVFSGLIILQVS